MPKAMKQKLMWKLKVAKLAILSLPRAKSSGGGMGRVILLSRGQREKGNLFARESWPFKAADFIQLIHLEEAYFILTHLSG